MCKKIANRVMFGINVLCFLIGAVLVIIGGLMLWGPEEMQARLVLVQYAFPSAVDDQPSLTMAHLAQITDQYVYCLSRYGLFLFTIGCIISSITLLWMMGVCCRSSRTISMSLLILSAVLLLLAILIIILLVKGNQLSESVGESFYTSLVQKYRFHGDMLRNISQGLAVIDVIDLIQIRAKCCGALSGWDYTMVVNRGNVTVPMSCCVQNATSNAEILYDDCTSSPSPTNSYYNTGCATTLTKVIQRFSFYVMCSFGALAISLFILIILATLMLRTFEE